MRRPIYLFMLFFFSLSCYSQSSVDFEMITKSIDEIRDIAIGDLDMDGDDDVCIVSSGFSKKMSWFENDGTGRFNYEHLISQWDADLTGQAVVIADFDQDGVNDVAYLTEKKNFRVLLNQLDDGFTSTAYGAAYNPQFQTLGGIAFGDLDGDDDLDIIYTGFNNDYLRWMANNGDGTFSNFITISYQDATDFDTIVIKDMDDDGDLDIVSNPRNYLLNVGLAWYENNGTGASFIEHVLDTEFEPTDINTADFDDDGDQDVLASSDDGIFWYEQLPGGLFSTGILVSDLGTNSTLWSDVDDDGDLDIVSGRTAPVGLGWHENDGTGNYLPLIVIYEDIDACHKILASDLDQDGIQDILVTNDHIANDRSLNWFEFGNNGSFGNINRITNWAVDGFQFADLDNDGDFDFITENGSEELIWSQNDGVGNFWAHEIIASDVSNVKATRTTDIDDDGDQDIIVASSTDGLSLFINNLPGPFQEISLVSGNTHTMELSDLNGDQYIDIVTYSLNQGFRWAAGNGTGFDSFQGIDIDVYGTEDIEIGDINGDGLNDIIVFEDGISYVLNLNGDFGAEQVLSDNPSYDRGLLADFDQDGDLDIMSCWSGGGLVMLPNNGSLQFGEPLLYSDQSICPAGYADFDLDGDLDVMTNRFIHLENLGGGLFFVDTEFDIGSVTTQTAMLDLDGDGRAESIGNSSYGIVQYVKTHSGDGCMDPTACNYDVNATTDDGACCYTNCGCTAPEAENYDASALCDDGSCLYTIQGQVWNDANLNGLKDGPETALAGQEVTMYPSAASVITDSTGLFTFEMIGLESFGIQHTLDSAFAFYTTSQIHTFGSSMFNPLIDRVDIGVVAEEPIYTIDVNLYGQGNGLPCDTAYYLDLCISNHGNAALDCVLEFEYDSLFQGYIALSEIDSSNANTVYLSIDQLPASQSQCLNIRLHTPTEEHIGEFLESILRVYGYENTLQTTYGEFILNQELTCAYDPNDKQVFPSGYTDAHYVNDDDYLEYLVRFQNTGNAPATDVIIRDTIDVGLDISSFQLVANSHSVYTTVDAQSREVEFYFQNIQLPDSVNNESESHGLVSYRILPDSGTPLLTELNNTAFIFFDNNQPIVTNTTWSTTYNCSLFEVSFNDDGAILTASEGDSYQWFFEGEAIAGATAQEYSATESGNYAVQVSSDFPCTDLTPSVYILVSGLQELNGETITFFPNPMTEIAILDLGNLQGSVQMEIFDITGKLVRSEQLTTNNQQLTLERGNLKSGNYLLRITAEEGTSELKFRVE